jgi:hypothetical protein
MVFSLTRIELTVAASPDSIRRAVTTPGGRPLHKPMVHYSPSPSSPDIVSHVASTSLPDNLANFCAYVENVYLKQCDPKIPLHYFTVLMTRQALCKLRIIDFLCRTANTDNVDQNERDSYFMEALRMVEYDNIIQSSDMLQGFRWYTYAHFPLPAYLCLVSELRHRTTGDLCERAWDVMIENHDRRGLLRRHDRNPLHIAFGRYFVKAWDAREAAELQLGRSLPTPKIVTLLRTTLAKTPPRPGPGPGHGSMPGGPMPGPMPPPIPNGAHMGPPTGHHQIPMQQQQPMAGMADMNMAPPPGMYAPSKPIPHPTTTTAPPPPQMNNAMMIDDSMMYSGGYDLTGASATAAMYGTNPAAAAAVGGMDTGMQDAEIGGMDWNYLVQLSSLSGFNPNPNSTGTGGYYVQQGTGA